MAGGFRFFRDDALLEEFSTMRNCERCSLSVYPDEGEQNVVSGEFLCPACNDLVYSRTRRMGKDRDHEHPLLQYRSCPIDPLNYILQKKFHRSHERNLSLRFRMKKQHETEGKSAG